MNCVVCGSTERKLKKKFESYSIYNCPSCSLSFCDPQPVTESASAGRWSVMTSEYYTQGLLETSAELDRRAKELAQNRHAYYSRRLGRNDYSLLEVGCGTARLALPFLKLGVMYDGLDIDARVIEAARASGITRVECQDYMDFPEDRKYDVILFSQVLEHIKDPHEFVRKVHSQLNVGGILHLDVPNDDSLASNFFRLARGNRTRYGAIEWPHHVFSYRIPTLRQLLSSKFKAEVFTANPNDPIWGQISTSNFLLKGLYVASKLLNRGSLLVAVGQKTQLDPST